MRKLCLIMLALVLVGMLQAAPDLSWMYTGDSGGGMRQSTYDSRIWYAVSSSTTWDKNATYDAPTGYHWAHTGEVTSIVKNNNNSSGNHVYYNQNGWNGYVAPDGQTRYYFRFADSSTANSYKHAGNYDEYRVQYSSNTSQFAGLVLMEGEDPYAFDRSLFSAPDWMYTGDDFGGMRRSTYDAKVWFAVAKNNVWDKNANYEIPTGFHWASTAEAQAIFGGNSNWSGAYTYYSQGGWNGYIAPDGKNRNYFRFSDSATTNAYKHAGNYDEFQVQYTSTTSGFAGLMLIQDEPLTNVPEPASLALLVLGAFLGLAVRRH